jgi:hypothetical protein
MQNVTTFSITQRQISVATSERGTSANESDGAMSIASMPKMNELPRNEELVCAILFMTHQFYTTIISMEI